MSATSSLVTALGAGSGVDMSKLAGDLAAAQFQPRTDRLAERSEVLERKISAASSLKNSLSLLASALGDRLRAGDLAVTPKIANSAVASGTSPPGTVGAGTFSLEVTQLARSQTLVAPALAAANTVVGPGTLSFRFGTTTGTSFAEDAAHEALTIELAAGATLQDVANAITARKAGLTAYVAQTASGAQLVVKGAEGQANGFAIDAAGGAELSSLAWDPTAGGDAARLLATSADAEFKLDGLAMTRPSNQTGIVAPGLSLTLTGTNAGAPTRIDFPSPIASLSGAMQDLVGALNSIAGDLNSVTGIGGDLVGDPGARALRSALSALAGQVIMPNASDTTPRTLADLGLATERDGTFRLDTARLQASLARDPSGVAAMFTTGLYGVYATIDKLARASSAVGSPGSLGGSVARYTAQSKKLSEDAAKLAEQQERLRVSLVSRFAKTDNAIGASKSTLSFLQAQIDAWNAQNSRR